MNTDYEAACLACTRCDAKQPSAEALAVARRLPPNICGCWKDGPCPLHAEVAGILDTFAQSAVAKVLARLTDDDVVEAVEEVINTDGTAEFQACRDALTAAREKLR